VLKSRFGCSSDVGGGGYLKLAWSPAAKRALPPFVLLRNYRDKKVDATGLTLMKMGLWIRMEITFSAIPF
jgi:hypothetical protein